MSSRHRQRPNHNQDADEERRLWNEIRANAKKIDTMVNKSAELCNEIVEVEKQQAAIVETEDLASAELDSRLESLYRENLKLSEAAQHIIEGMSSEMNLLDSINILAGLRDASEEASRHSLNLSNSKSRSTTLKRKLGVSEDGEDGSAAPSPRPGNGSRERLGVEKKEKRGGSVPSTREVSVKIEDGAESATSSVEGSKPPSEPSRRLTLALGAMVFYKTKTRASEGEGILCRVTSVIGEGKQRRYEIQDADPEPDPTTGDLPAPYRASVAHLVPIPRSNDGLGDLPKGRGVLAQYPDTTTFYKAEVSAHWRAKDLNESKDGCRGQYVRLRFEGEQEEGIWQEVERRFVLADK
ncbi:hypothetical protein AAFC00_004898 [Neodothiora populina]|uniref:SGF29 C-terminal domain-containing protein n=1 Tax=Neodothiora populina TaxID=2781224 RepID=A0ABR3P3J2_9PEZI